MHFTPLPSVGQANTHARQREELAWTPLSSLVYAVRDKSSKRGEAVMKVIADVGIVPIGVGVSLSRYVAECERIFKEAGLKTRLHAYGTNLEGDWETVFAAIRRCHEVLHDMGVPRISTVIKVGTRSDRDQTMNDKVASVEEKLVV